MEASRTREPVRPARPGLGLTPDGRPWNVTTSYIRRGSRLKPHQQQIWDRHRGDWLIPDEVVDAGWPGMAACFGREAPLVVEIGSGAGEALAALAAARPECNVLGLEVWRPGVVKAFAELQRAGCQNVRLLSVDATWVLEHLVASGGLAELWTFFPDPWPKARHHKRRLVDRSFAALVADRIAPGGLWRLATDWDDYAAQIQEVLGEQQGLTGGVVERWPERPETKFERRGRDEGRQITDLCYRRSTAARPSPTGFAVAQDV